MMDYMNQIISVVVKLVITGAGTAFIAYGIPYLKQIGMYKIVQMAVRVKVTPVIEMMIEAAVKELDIQNEKIETELKKD